jgi:hypothetical protein
MDQMYRGRRLKEKDVEESFVNYLKSKKDFPYIVVGRQIPLPLGIVDILAVEDNDTSRSIHVIEVKKDKVDLSACGQLLGYLYQIEYILNSLERDKWGESLSYANEWWIPFHGVLVGASFDERVYRISSSKEGIGLYQYHVNGDSITFEDVHGGYLDDEEMPPIDARLRKAMDWCMERREQYSFWKQAAPTRDYTHSFQTDKQRHYSIELSGTRILWKAGSKQSQSGPSNKLFG